MKKSSKGAGISFRPKKGYRERLEDLAKATERPKTFFLDKAVEAHLPELERRYARELEEFHRHAQAINPGLNDTSTPYHPGKVIDPIAKQAAQNAVEEIAPNSLSPKEAVVKALAADSSESEQSETSSKVHKPKLARGATTAGSPQSSYSTPRSGRKSRRGPPRNPPTTNRGANVSSPLKKHP